jgi:hypothetical protein
MKSIFFRSLILSLTIFSLTFGFKAAAAASQNIYLSFSGNDNNDGLTAKKSVASLQRALYVANSLSLNNLDKVKILVGEGVYLKQSAVTQGLSDGGVLEIRPLDANKPRPKFDGGGVGDTWLRIKIARGFPSKIGVYGLEIVNFETAISIDGSRNDKNMWNGENIIRNNIFMNIGQIARDGAKPSTAAIRLVNSDRNIIFRNKFINIRNSERCSLLHAIYVAHDSTDNVIESNIFDSGCGDAIRFRDSSHRNIVKDNTFRDAWDKAPVSDWYCDGGNREDCTKSAGECPSLNNVVDSNKISTRRGNSVPQTLTYGPDLSLHCPKAVSNMRFIVK